MEIVRPSGLALFIFRPAGLEPATAELLAPLGRGSVKRERKPVLTHVPFERKSEATQQPEPLKKRHYCFGILTTMDTLEQQPQRRRISGFPNMGMRQLPDAARVYGAEYPGLVRESRRRNEVARQAFAEDNVRLLGELGVGTGEQQET